MMRLHLSYVWQKLPLVYELKTGMVPVVVAVCAFLYLMWLMPYISVTMAHFYRVMCQERGEGREEPPAPPPAGGGGGDERTVPYWEQPYRSLEGENGAASDSRRDPDRPF